MQAERARAHRRLQQQVAASRVTAPQIFDLRGAPARYTITLPAKVGHSLLGRRRLQILQQLRSNLWGCERGWQVGSRPKRPSTPQARCRQQSTIPTRQNGGAGGACVLFANTISNISSSTSMYNGDSREDVVNSLVLSAFNCKSILDKAFKKVIMVASSPQDVAYNRRSSAKRMFVNRSVHPCARAETHLSGDQHLPCLEQTGAFRNNVWRKQSVVFRKVS